MCFLAIGHSKYNIIFIALLVFILITPLMTPSDQWCEGMQFRDDQKSAENEHRKA